GVDAVVDAVAVLVRAGDVVDRVGAVRVRGHPTGPELGDAAEHRPAVPAQPGRVAGGQVVLPDRESDVALEVDLGDAVRRVHAVALRRQITAAGAVPRVEQAL